MFSVFSAPAASAEIFLAVADDIFSAAYFQRHTVHQSQSKFFSGALIYLLNRCAGYIHIFAALFLRKPLFINKAYSLIFVNCENNFSL